MDLAKPKSGAPLFFLIAGSYLFFKSNYPKKKKRKKMKKKNCSPWESNRRGTKTTGMKRGYAIYYTTCAKLSKEE